MVEVYELSARFDSRKSFYGKAHVKQYEDGSLELVSYTTTVARIDANGHYESLGKWSQTTTRHQNEFRKQFAKD